MVHLSGGAALPLNRHLVRIDIPTAIWAERVTFEAPAHIGWDALPEGQVSLNWGAKWADDARSALALVPSIIVPEEMNVLVNPRHPDSAAVKSVKLRKWLYDARLLGDSRKTAAPHTNR